MALFRAIIKLLGKEPPIARAEVIAAVGSASHVDTSVFTDLLLLKTGRIRPAGPELYSLFERYYNALEATGKIIDELPS
jgi:deoxyribodipyrimidine photolyase